LLEPLRIFPVLETRDQVVGVADDNYVKGAKRRLENASLPTRPVAYAVIGAFPVSNRRLSRLPGKWFRFGRRRRSSA